MYTFLDQLELTNQDVCQLIQTNQNWTTHSTFVRFFYTLLASNTCLILDFQNQKSKIWIGSIEDWIWCLLLFVEATLNDTAAFMDECLAIFYTFSKCYTYFHISLSSWVYINDTYAEPSRCEWTVADLTAFSTHVVRPTRVWLSNFSMLTEIWCLGIIGHS
jgi:hypothetical protein